MEGKVCGKCGVWKPLEEYYKHKGGKDGRKSQCKKCKKEYKKQYYKNHAEHIKEREKQYRKDHAEYYKEYDKQYYQDNAEHKKEYFKQYYQDNAEYKKECSKQRYQDNTENNLQYISSIVKQIRPIFKELSLPVYGYIYKFENIKTGHVYIGQSIRPLDIRYGSNAIKSWIKERKHYQNQKFLNELIEEDIIVTELFDVACCQYHLDKLEAYWINYYDSYNNGYNNNAGYYNTDDGLEEFNKILEKNGLEFINGKLKKIV